MQVTAKKNLYAKTEEMSGNYYLFLFNDQLIVSQPTKHHQYQYIRYASATFLPLFLSSPLLFTFLAENIFFCRSWLLEACSVIEMDEGM